MIYTEPTTIALDRNTEIIATSGSPLILTNVPKKKDEEPKHLAVAGGGSDVLRFSTWRKRNVRIVTVDEGIPYQVITRKRQVIAELSPRRKKVQARSQENELEKMMNDKFLRMAANLLGEDSVEYESLEESLDFDIDENDPFTLHEAAVMEDEQLLVDLETVREAPTPANKKPAASEQADSDQTTEGGD